MATNLVVSVRCRPIKTAEKASTLKVVDDDQVVSINNREFEFDKVFSPDSSQEEVFNNVVKPLVFKSLQGYNCTVFAYGQTGTGKTYTMEGDRLAPDTAGMVPRAVSEILRNLRSKDGNFITKVSFIEIFNEEVYDLLTDDTSKLRIFDDSQKKGSVVIDGVRELNVGSETDILGLLSQGAAKRQTTTTLLNARSSRSHSIFSIRIEQGDRLSKLNLVDLAGSENIARSGALDKHAREAGNINQSLLTLTRVITALVEKRPHIPYRESKLTRILQDSLGGSTRTSMIATISPSENDINNTLGTLDYASRARSIANRPEANFIPQKRSFDDREMQALRDKHAAELIEQEYRIRNEVANEFRRETERYKDFMTAQHEKHIDQLMQQIKNLNEQLQQSKEELQQSKEELQQSKVELQQSKEELQHSKEQLQQKQEDHEKLNRELKIKDSLCKYRDELNQQLANDLKLKTLELQALENKPPHETSTNGSVEHIQKEENNENKKKASKIRKRVPEQEDNNGYANVTFDGNDELVESAQIPRKKLNADPKKRDPYNQLTQSGKKKKLKTTDDDDDEVEITFPPSPTRPTRPVTRSRVARRELKY